METIFTKDKLAQSKAAYTIEANMLRPVSFRLMVILGLKRLLSRILTLPELDLLTRTIQMGTCSY